LKPANESIPPPFCPVLDGNGRIVTESKAAAMSPKNGSSAWPVKTLPPPDRGLICELKIDW
jgi:hypothetical protein